MTRDEFLEKINKSQRPLVVEFWAPWCGPCKVMAPRLKKAEQKFAGQVDLLRVNADEAPEVARQCRVMGIPTLIAYKGGKEIFRKVGVQSDEGLEAVFEGAQAVQPPKTTLQPIERWFRFLSGAALTAFGVARGPAWVLVVVGLLVIFSAVYDRCPIYAAVSERVKRLFSGD